MSGGNATLRVKCPGGIVTPAQLRMIAELSYAVGAKRLYPGSRQDLLLPDVDEREWERVRPAYQPLEAEFDGREQYPNIVSSAAAVDVAAGTNWVDEGVFREALGLLSGAHALKINLVDPRQNLIPLYSGHLNFHAAEQPRHWRCCLRFPATFKILPLRQRIAGSRLAEYAWTLEQLLRSRAPHDPEQLNRRLDELPGIISDAPPDEPPAAINEYLNYDGIHEMKNREGLWLGIFNADEPFRYSFLVELAVLATRHNLGAIHLTPWRALLIKYLRPEQQHEWRQLLGRHKIKLRHSDLQLFWQLPDDWPADAQLKKEIVRQMRESSAVSAGISFALAQSGRYHETALSIEKCAGDSLLNKIGGRETFCVKYRPGFKRFSDQVLVFAGRVKKTELGRTLGELINRYYAGDASAHEAPAGETAPAAATAPVRELFQCQVCKTIYDDSYGDPVSGIGPGSAFNELPGNWCCPVCESPKPAYSLLVVN